MRANVTTRRERVEMSFHAILRRVVDSRLRRTARAATMAESPPLASAASPLRSPLAAGRRAALVLALLLPAAAGRSHRTLAAGRGAPAAADGGRRGAPRCRARRRRRLPPRGRPSRPGGRVLAGDPPLAAAAGLPRRRQPRDGRDVARQGDRRRRLRSARNSPQRPRVRAGEQRVARAAAAAGRPRGRGRRRVGDTLYVVAGIGPSGLARTDVRAQPADEPVAGQIRRPDAARAPRGDRLGGPALRAGRTHFRAQHEPPHVRVVARRGPQLDASAPGAELRAAGRPRRRSAGRSSRSAARSRRGRSRASSPTTRGHAAGAGCRTSPRRATASARRARPHACTRSPAAPQPGLTSSGADESSPALP